MRSPALRWTLAAVVIAAMLASAISFRADAQSEYMRGDRMPYDAFDRLPKTDIEVPGGTIHVAFASGDITLPKEKLLGWIRMSARAVTTYYGRFPVASLRLLLVPVDGARIRREGDAPGDLGDALDGDEDLHPIRPGRARSRGRTAGRSPRARP